MCVPDLQNIMLGTTGCSCGAGPVVQLGAVSNDWSALEVITAAHAVCLDMMHVDGDTMHVDGDGQWLHCLLQVVL